MNVKSYAYSEEEFDSALCYQIWNEVTKLRLYFRKFCKGNADEAMQMAVLHALTHFSPTKGDLVCYIKKLAREITKDNGKLVPCDFLEQTVTVGADSKKISQDLINTNDISEDIVGSIVLSASKREEIVNLSLSFMNFFLTMCESISSKDTTTQYFPDIFISECLALSKKCKTFNQECLSIYSQYADKFRWFLNTDEGNVGVWRETDCDMVAKNGSKRVKIVNKDGTPCDDPDTNEWMLKGNLNGKRVIKIPYYKVWDLMCDLIDEDGINVMKFTIDYSYIVKTLGGSLSIVDPILMNEYELCRLEILTNLLRDTNGRYLAIGSKCMYFLVDSETVKDLDNLIPDRLIKGIELKFDAFDVTRV